MKYYVFRINKKTDIKEYMKTKCVGGWSLNKASCWQFSRQGARGIVTRYSQYVHPAYAAYEYGMERVV